MPTKASGAGTITPKTLTASIIGDPTKPYDGNTTASLTSSNFSLSGLIGSENFTVTQTSGTYNSKDVLTASTVTASLSADDFTAANGTLASDYTLPTTASGAGTITPETLTASIIGDPTKPYGGNTTASLTSSNFSLSGLIGSENFTVTQTSGTYNSKDVLTASTVTASLSADDFTAANGTLASDYTLPTTASGAGTITPEMLTASIIGDPTKPYGGNTTASLTSSNFSLSGLIGSENFTVTQTSATYNSKDVLTASTVTASLSAEDFTAANGTLASDYMLPTTASGAGTITPAPLIISANDQTMAAGDAVPQLTASYQGLVGGDTSASLTTPVVLATSATSSSAAGVYPITPSGASSPDYAISYRAGTLTISPTTVALTTPDGAAVYGQSVTFTATVSTAATPSGTVAFSDGTTLLAMVPLDGTNTAMLTTTTLSTGSHTITALYKGTTSIQAEQSAPSSVTVAPTGTNVVVVQTPVLKNRKLTSVRLTAQITPTAPGGGMPGGEVTFELLTKAKKKIKTTTLGSVAVSSGDASLTLSAKKVKGKTITVIYSGDADDKASALTTAKIR